MFTLEYPCHFRHLCPHKPYLQEYAHSSSSVLQYLPSPLCTEGRWSKVKESVSLNKLQIEKEHHFH